MCDIDLPPASESAMICTYECTFCRNCVDAVLSNVCPNCGGGFATRPIRPVGEWRPGISLALRPASTERHYLEYELDDITALSSKLKDVQPANR
jgi:hypothetical protein